DFPIAGWPIEIVHDARPECRMADEHRRIDRGRPAIEGAEIVAQPREAVVRPFAQQPELLGQRPPRDEWRQAEPAVACDDGGDSLARLAVVQGLVEKYAIIVGMDVDKAGGEHAADAIDLDL